MFRLFPLPLEGKGTSDVESLPSYVLRLARVHAVSVATLLNSLPYERSVNSANKLLSGCLGSLVRPNATTRLVVDALARVCSEDRTALHAATLLPLEEAMARSASSFSPHLRWCPLCLAEQAAGSETTYLKLAWQLSGVEACIDHRVRLHDTCPECGNVQRGWRRMVPLELCEQCGIRLDRMPQPARTLEQCAPDLLHLIKAIASEPPAEFPAGGSSMVVRTLVDSLKESGACPDRLAHVEVLEISRYARNRLMSLPMARRVAFQLSITLAELFSGDVRGINHVFGFCLLNPLPGSLAPSSRSHLASEREMYRALLAVIEQSRLAPSLRQVTRHLGVSVGALRYRFPREATQIARAWRKRNVMATKRRLAKVRNAVARCIDEWSTRHRGKLTKKGVLRFLRRTTDLPKEPLRREIDHALMALEFRRKLSQRCVRLGVRDPGERSNKGPEASSMKGSADEDISRALAWVPRSGHRTGPTGTTAAPDLGRRLRRGEPLRGNDQPAVAGHHVDRLLAK